MSSRAMKRQSSDTYMLEKKPVELLLAAIVRQAGDSCLADGAQDVARRVDVHGANARDGLHFTKRLDVGELETRRDRVDAERVVDDVGS